MGVWGTSCFALTLCPLQANLVVQENRHVLAMQDLQKAQAELDDKQAELDVVQAEYEQATSEKQVAKAWHGRDVCPFHWLLWAAIPMLSLSDGLVFCKNAQSFMYL